MPALLDGLPDVTDPKAWLAFAEEHIDRDMVVKFLLEDEKLPLNADMFAGWQTELRKLSQSEDLARLADALPTVKRMLADSDLARVGSIEEACAAAVEHFKPDHLAQTFSAENLMALAGAILADVKVIIVKQISDLTGGAVSRQVLTTLLDPAAMEKVVAGDDREFLRAVAADLTRFLQPHVEALVAECVGPEWLPRLEQTVNGLRPVLSDPEHITPQKLVGALFGLAPELLEGPEAVAAADVATFVGTVGPGLVAGLKDPEAALEVLCAPIIEAIGRLDRSEVGVDEAVAQIVAAADAGADALASALEGLYDGLLGTVRSETVDLAVTTLETLLGAIDLSGAPSVAELLTAFEAMADDLVGRLPSAAELAARYPALDGAALERRVGALLNGLQAQGQQLKQLCDQPRALLDQGISALAAVPVRQVTEALETGLGALEAKLDELGLAAIPERMAQTFHDLEAKVVGEIIKLADSVGQQLDDAAQQLLDLGVLDQVEQTVKDALDQLKKLVVTFGDAVKAQKANLDNALLELEDLSLKPVGDLVVGQIDDITARLKAIDPKALSEPERLAIRGATAALDAIDLSGQVTGTLKPAYHDEVEAAVLSLLDELERIVATLTAAIHHYDPKVLLAPVTALLARGEREVASWKARQLLDFLWTAKAEVAGALDYLNPDALLEALQGPYLAVTGALDVLDPARWGQAVRDLYAQAAAGPGQLGELIKSYVAELDHLKAKVQGTLAFDPRALGIPDGLGLTPALTAISHAISGQPVETTPFTDLLAAKVTVDAVLGPLDDLFEQLVAAAEPAALAEAIDSARQAIRLVIGQLDPRPFVTEVRAGVTWLGTISPARLFSQEALPALRQTLLDQLELLPGEAEAVASALRGPLQQFVDGLDPAKPTSRFHNLLAKHDELVAALLELVDRLGESLIKSYVDVRADIERILPDVLHRPTAVTPEDVTALLETFRPSDRLAGLGPVVDVARQALAPLAAGADAALAELARATGTVFAVLDSGPWVQEVDKLTTTLRAKVAELNPEEALAIVGRIFGTIRGVVAAFDPSPAPAGHPPPAAAGTAPPLGILVQEAVATLKAALLAGLDKVLEAIEGAVDKILAVLVAKVKSILAAFQGVVDTGSATFQELVGELEDLLFTQILGRLRRIVEKLGRSFDTELDRVMKEFDSMLHAIPVS